MIDSPNRLKRLKHVSVDKSGEKLREKEEKSRGIWSARERADVYRQIAGISGWRREENEEK